MLNMAELLKIENAINNLTPIEIGSIIDEKIDDIDIPLKLFI